MYSVHGLKARLRLEDRFLSALVKSLTCAMRWLAACHRGLHRVGENSRRPLLKLVAPFLTVLVCQCSSFFFDCVYVLNKRRALLVYRNYLRLSMGKVRIEFPESRLRSLPIPQHYHRLSDFLHVIEEKIGSGNG